MCSASRRKGCHRVFGLSAHPSAVAGATAVLLPDDLVLTRRIELPSVAEAELAAIAVLEAEANSPFSKEDTSFRVAGTVERGIALNPDSDHSLSAGD